MRIAHGWSANPTTARGGPETIFEELDFSPGLDLHRTSAPSQRKDYKRLVRITFGPTSSSSQERNRPHRKLPLLAVAEFLIRSTTRTDRRKKRAQLAMSVYNIMLKRLDDSLKVPG
jgi:hypothetical protein